LTPILRITPVLWHDERRAFWVATVSGVRGAATDRKCLLGTGGWRDDGARAFVRHNVAEAMKKTSDGAGIDRTFLHRVVELHCDAV
jgi:hypothetical protein